MPWWWRVWQTCVFAVVGVAVGLFVLAIVLFALIYVLIELGVLEPWD